MVGEILIFTDKGYKNIPDLLSYASSNECCLTYRRAKFLSLILSLNFSLSKNGRY